MPALAVALRACGLVGACSQVTHIFGADCALAIEKHCNACMHLATMADELLTSSPARTHSVRGHRFCFTCCPPPLVVLSLSTRFCCLPWSMLLACRLVLRLCM